MVRTTGFQPVNRGSTPLGANFENRLKGGFLVINYWIFDI